MRSLKSHNVITGTSAYYSSDREFPGKRTGTTQTPPAPVFFLPVSRGQSRPTSNRSDALLCHRASLCNTGKVEACQRECGEERRGAGRRMIHRLRQTEGLAESLAAEVNILTPSHMRTRTARCTHRTALYLDDRWRHEHTPHKHTPHEPFTLLSGSGLKTIYIFLNFPKIKSQIKSSSQHPWFSLPGPVLPPSSVCLCLSSSPSPSVVLYFILRGNKEKICYFSPHFFFFLLSFVSVISESNLWADRQGTTFSTEIWIVHTLVCLSAFPLGSCPPWAPTSTCGRSELCEFWGLSNSYPGFQVSRSSTFNNL